VLLVGGAKDLITSVTFQSHKQALCIERERPRWEGKVVAIRFMR
jgi:hypothetical protein